MLKSIIILYFTSILSLIYSYSNPGSVIMAINSGSKEQYISKNGIKYSEDLQYDNKSTAETKSLLKNDKSWQQIRFTKDYELCRSYRTAKGDFAYFIPLNHPGSYVLTLQMCELNVAEKGARVMQIWFGQTIIVHNTDIYSEVGELTSYHKYIQFELNEDKQIILTNNDRSPDQQGKICQNAFDGHQLLVIFKSMTTEPPFVNSILLTEGTIINTDMREKEKQMEDWAAKSNENATKKNFKKLSDNFKKVYWDKRFKQQDAYNFYEPHYIPQDKFQNLTDLLFQPKGIFMTVILLTIVICYITLDDDNAKDVLEITKQGKEKIVKKEKKNK